MSLITLGMGAATGSAGTGNMPAPAMGVMRAAYPAPPVEVEYEKVRVPPAPKGVTYG